MREIEKIFDAARFQMRRPRIGSKLKVLEQSLFGMLLRASVIECESNLKCVDEAFFSEGEENVRYYYALPLEINVHVTIRRNLEDDANLTGFHLVNEMTNGS